MQIALPRIQRIAIENKKTSDWLRMLELRSETQKNQLQLSKSDTICQVELKVETTIKLVVFNTILNISSH